MSDEEFLARWSRLKGKARADNDAPQPAEPTQARGPAPPSDGVEDPPTPDVDLSSLPPLDSIDAATDIAAFLRKGIPQELSRAALRRAWTTDPAIRDFVGLAENAWDFNDPTAMPGFGPLDCSEAELRALVDRIVGGVREAAEALPNPPGEAKEVGRMVSSGHDPAQEPKPAEAIAAAPCTTDESAPVEPASSPAAPQPSITARGDSEEPSVRRRTHGGALPR
jgi:Protein of unknown function (DUF3306)